MTEDPLRMGEVMDCLADVMRHLAARADDAAVKMAALKSAAAVYENAIATAAMTQTLNSLLGGPKK